MKANAFRPDPKPEKVEKAKKVYKFKSKPTGEYALFQEIWEERGPYSQISGEFLGEFNICFFSHILPKGQNKYPKFKLKKENVVIKSFDEHYNWEHNKKSLVGDPLWLWVFDLEDSLKMEYAGI